MSKQFEATLSRPASVVVALACLALAGSAPALAQSAPPAPAASSGPMVATSVDGRLTVSSETGTLPGLAINELSRPNDVFLPARPQGLSVAFAYVIEPKGGTLNQPVTVQYRTDYATADFMPPNTDAAFPYLPIVLLAVLSPDGSWEWLGNQAMRFDGTTLTLSGSMAHMGTVVGYHRTRVGLSASSWATTGYPGVGVDWVITFDGQAVEGPEDRQPVLEPASSTVAPEIAGIGIAVQSPGTITAHLTCSALGDIWVEATIRVSNLTALSINDGFGPLGRLGLPGPTDLELTLASELSCSPRPHRLTWICLEALHRSNGRRESRLFADLELQRSAYQGSEVRSISIRIQGVNHGRAWVLDGISGDEFVERSIQLDTPGYKVVRKVELNLDDGRTLDVTDRVLELLGTSGFEVRYPDDMTVGTCHGWIPKPAWRIS